MILPHQTNTVKYGTLRTAYYNGFETHKQYVNTVIVYCYRIFGLKSVKKYVNGGLFFEKIQKNWKKLKLKFMIEIYVYIYIYIRILYVEYTYNIRRVYV